MYANVEVEEGVRLGPGFNLSGTHISTEPINSNARGQAAQAQNNARVTNGPGGFAVGAPRRPASLNARGINEE